jgi:glycosyl transferase, family 25
MRELFVYFSVIVNMTKMTDHKARTAIRVINLDTSLERREEFTQMASSKKLDWAFFPAHTSKTEPLQYDGRAAVRRCGRSLSPFEIGCYASHFKLWEWLSNSDLDQIIIFEDDIIADWAFIEKLAAIRFADYGINLLRLHAYSPFNWKVVKYKFLSENNHLVILKGMVPGAAAYLLSKAAACNFVSNYSIIDAPLDWVLPRYWEHRVLNYCIFPFPVLHQDGPSTIGDERYAVSQRATIYERLARIGWRVLDRTERTYVDHCLIKRFPLGPTKDSGPPFIPAEPITAAAEAAQQLMQQGNFIFRKRSLRSVKIAVKNPGAPSTLPRQKSS